MILTDYLKSERDGTWSFARQCGVTNAVIRLPDEGFDFTDPAQWKGLIQKYEDYGFKPLVLEPLPDRLHDHIKAGDGRRDMCIDQTIRMFPIMEACGVRTLCFNFMAYVGWLRTSDKIAERGGAQVTGFRLSDYVPDGDRVITEEKLWHNYAYFIQAVLPYAEKHGIRLALHPDDPPVNRLGGISRIMTSYENIHRAVHLVESDFLGVTMCQATYVAMGESLDMVIPAFARENKVFFVHFRDIVGNKYDFHETFHDNGQTDMARALRLYRDNGVNVPIRVDHVPTMTGEKDVSVPGYGALGRLYAIGYLRGLMEMMETF